MEDFKPVADAESAVDSKGCVDIDQLIESTRGRICQIQEESNWKLCPPKLLPLKTFTVEKLEKLQKEAEEQLKNIISD